MASRKIICSFIFVQMLLIIINTEGTEIFYKERRRKRDLFYKERKRKGDLFYKEKKRKRDFLNTENTESTDITL